MHNKLWIGVALAAVLMTGCSQKELNSSKKEVVSSVKKEAVSKAEEKVAKVEKKVDEALKVEVAPVVDKKVKVITETKPEIAVLTTEKVAPNQEPVVVVDAVEADVPVESVEVLPKVGDEVGIVAKVKPTIEMVEEIEVPDEETPAVVIEPVVE